MVEKIKKYLNRIIFVLLIANSVNLPFDHGSALAESIASEWVLEHLSNAPVTTGELTGRKTIEMPGLVYNANSTSAGKNAFQARNFSPPDDNQIGFVNVNISGLFRDNSPTGAGIATDRNGDNIGTIVYLSNVYIAPGWPDFTSYDDANFDGIVLDGSSAVYGHNVTITDVNSDAAIDNKAEVSQFVGLRVSGNVNRSLRYWRDGPHYLVDSNIDNPGDIGAGTLIWFRDCTNAELRVYNSYFNGSRRIPADKVKCDNNTGPLTITYLTKNPRGSLHPMLRSAGIPFTSLNNAYQLLLSAED